MNNVTTIIFDMYVMFDRDKEEYEGIKVNTFEELVQVIEG